MFLIDGDFVFHFLEIMFQFVLIFLDFIDGLKHIIGMVVVFLNQIMYLISYYSVLVESVNDNWNFWREIFESIGDERDILVGLVQNRSDCHVFHL